MHLAFIDREGIEKLNLTNRDAFTTYFMDLFKSWGRPVGSAGVPAVGDTIFSRTDNLWYKAVEIVWVTGMGKNNGVVVVMKHIPVVRVEDPEESKQ